MISPEPRKPLDPLRDRKFVELSRDNFDEVLDRMKPALQFQVENTIAGDGSEMSVDLEFKSMKDFTPGEIAMKNAATRKLMETRERLKSLMAVAQSDDELRQAVEQLINDPDLQSSVKDDLDKADE